MGVEVGGWEECPGQNGPDVEGGGWEECPGQNGPDGAVDPNSFDTQNIVACHVQVTEGLNYNFQLNAKDGVLFCDVHWSESPEYDCSLHEHVKNKWPCVDPGTCSKHCLHHGCKQE